MSELRFHADGSPLCQGGGVTVHPVSVWDRHGTAEFYPCWYRARYRSYEGVHLCGRHLRYAGRVTALNA